MEEPLELLPRHDIVAAVGKGRVLLIVGLAEVFGAVIVLSALGFGIWQPTTLTIVAAVLLVSAGMILAMRSTLRRLMGKHAPTRLIVADDRIALDRKGGRGTEWCKEHGGLVRVAGRGRNRSIQIGQQVSAIPPVVVRMFGLDDLKTACIAKGWSWQEGDGPVLDAMPHQPPDGDEVELLLRDGNVTQHSTGRSKGRTWLVILGCVVVYAAASLLAIEVTVRTDTDLTWLPVAVAVVLVVSWIGGVVWHIWRVVRTSRVSLVVGPDRATCWHGATSVVVSRESVSRVVANDKKLVMYTASGSVALSTGSFGHGAEIATLLREHGWPVIDLAETVRGES